MDNGPVRNILWAAVTSKSVDFDEKTVEVDENMHL
jgi:hypothetical protein